MISLKLTRWLIGSVRFSVENGSPERFYTKCARAGLYLWDIAPGPNGGACIAVHCYHLLRPNCTPRGMPPAGKRAPRASVPALPNPGALRPLGGRRCLSADFLFSFAAHLVRERFGKLHGFSTAGGKCAGFRWTFAGDTQKLRKPESACRENHAALSADSVDERQSAGQFGGNCGSGKNGKTQDFRLERRL